MKQNDRRRSCLVRKTRSIDLLDVEGGPVRRGINVKPGSTLPMKVVAQQFYYLVTRLNFFFLLFYIIYIFFSFTFNQRLSFITFLPCNGFSLFYFCQFYSFHFLSFSNTCERARMIFFFLRIYVRVPGEAKMAAVGWSVKLTLTTIY